jgi:hypothetical protein
MTPPAARAQSESEAQERLDDFYYKRARRRRRVRRRRLGVLTRHHPRAAEGADEVEGGVDFDEACRSFVSALLRLIQNHDKARRTRTTAKVIAVCVCDTRPVAGDAPLRLLHACEHDPQGD